MTTNHEPDSEAGMVETCFDRIEALMADLDESQWQVQSLCPDWDVRGVVLHLAAIEHVLTGWQPTGPDDSLPFDRIGPFLSELEGADNAQVTARTREVFEQRRQDLRSLDDEALEIVGPTPVGPATYRQFMRIRVFDFWVHERDITTPLGIPTDDSGPTAEVALDQVHHSLGYIVGKKIGLPDGMSIRFDVQGPVGRSMAVKVDGRARVVELIDQPDVVVTSDLVTFIQLACGRIDPDGAIESGTVSWTGDDDWGWRAATNLRFTM